MRALIFLFALMLALQGGFWWQWRGELPTLAIVPDVPGETTVKALALGDEQTFFRALALNLQNAGDTFGRSTALYKYDFNRLYHWFLLLDGLDARSNYVPTMASFYFSQTQHRPDVRYVVDYLVKHADGRVAEKWWWLVQASYLAEHKLRDAERALAIAKLLEGERSIPIWAQQMPAFFYEKQGEMDKAAAIIEAVIKDAPSLKQSELNFMYYFVKERLERLDRLESELREAQRTKRSTQDAPAMMRE
jgi:tetratricopeptide (TPR) repeat protein